jgi:hypothetical protein
MCNSEVGIFGFDFERRGTKNMTTYWGTFWNRDIVQTASILEEGRAGS